jgi:hypothetical protein
MDQICGAEVQKSNAWCIDGIAYLMDNAALCQTAIKLDAWIMELSELKTTWQLVCTPRACDAQGRTKLSLDVQAVQGQDSHFAGVAGQAGD